MEHLDEYFEKVINDVSHYFMAYDWHDWQIVKSDLEFGSSKPFYFKSQDSKNILYAMLQKHNDFKLDKNLITLKYKSSLDIYKLILNFNEVRSHTNVPNENSLFKSDKLIDIFKNSIIQKNNKYSFDVDYENHEMNVFEVLWACHVFYSEIIKRVWDNINFEAVSCVDTVFSRYSFYAGQLCKEWDKHRTREKIRTDESTKSLNLRKTITRKLLFEFLRERKKRFKESFGVYTIYSLIKEDWEKLVTQMRKVDKKIGAIPKSKSGLAPYIKEYLDIQKPKT